MPAPAAYTFEVVIPPGRLSPASQPGGRIQPLLDSSLPVLASYLSTAVPPGRISPINRMFLNRINDLRSHAVTANTFYVCQQTGNDLNSGDSLALERSASDGTTNNTNTFTTPTGAFTPADVGRFICITNAFTYRPIVKVNSPTSVELGGAPIAGAGSVPWRLGGPWATMGSPLNGPNSPVRGGDTVYISSGIYRDTVHFDTSPQFSGARVNIIGDVTGRFTGQPAGEVRYTNNIDNLNSGSSLFALASNMNFANIHFVFYADVFRNPAPTSHDITFTDCAFTAGTGLATWTSGGPSAPINLLFDRCDFFTPANGPLVTFSLPTNSERDYDANVMFRNCRIVCFGVCFTVTGTGALPFKGGGIRVENCTVFMGNSFMAPSANLTSIIYPCTVYGCLLIAGGGNTCLATPAAGNTGQLIEDYNIVAASFPRTTAVVAGQHTISSTGSTTPLFHYGQERIWGGTPRPFGTPMRDANMLGFGAPPGVASIDILSKPRPGGVGRLLASGTATSAAANTITDSGANFGTNTFMGAATIKIVSGTGAGQYKLVKTHTPTAITVYSNWVTTPDATSVYAVYHGVYAETVQVTSSTNAVITVSNANWQPLLTGFTLEIISGTGAGQITTVSSSTTTTLTLVSPLPIPPDSTSVIKVYRGTGGVDAILPTAGALERHDTAELESVVTDAGSGWKLKGFADQELRVAVDATSTTISIKNQFNVDHGNLNKPQVILVANPEIGVAAQTVTAQGTAGSGSWETIALAAFTPTAKGVVTVRVVSRAALATGIAYFDTVSVT